MRVIVFSTPHHDMPLALGDIASFKIAYLLADTVLLAGEAGAHFSFEQNYMNFDVKKKKLIMEDHYLQATDPDVLKNKEAGFEYFEKFMEAWRFFHNSINKSKDHVVKFKLAERGFNGYYERIVKRKLEALENVQAADFAKLIDNKTVQTALHEFSIGEFQKLQNNPQLLAKKLLHFLFPIPSPTEPTILILPCDFICEGNKLENGLLDLNADSDFSMNINESQTRLLDFVLLPSFNQFPATSLKVIRKQLDEKGARTRKKVDEWLLLCRECTDALKRRKFLIDEVIRESIVLEDAIIENEFVMLSDTSKGPDVFHFDVYIGETPIGHIIDYFKESKMLNQETIDVILNMTANNPQYPSIVPIICSMPRNIDDEDNDEDDVDEDEETDSDSSESQEEKEKAVYQSLKKSLSFDD